jgi:hypothetical protein
MFYLSIDFMLNKDQRYEDLINEYEEIDSYLLHNLITGNVFLIIALIIVFSLEFIRVIIRENFAAIVFTTALSIQIDIVWHILALVFAFMIYVNKNKFNV